MAVQLGGYTAREINSPLTGTLEVPLTRAVIPYRARGEGALHGGRLHDIGLGAVVDGNDPSRADVVDLGSAQLRVVDLTGPLVVLGWLYPSGLSSLRRTVLEEETGDREGARSFTFKMALRVLDGVGFGPLTRPTLLRIGFRDLCQDLDLHEGTAVRLILPAGGVARVHLDYDGTTLVVRTGRSRRCPDLEGALTDAFPERELFRTVLRDPVGTEGYHLPFPTPRSLSEVRDLMSRLRRGLIELLERFEPDRCRSLRALTGVLGARDSLRSLRGPIDPLSLERVPRSPSGASGRKGVH